MRGPVAVSPDNVISVRLTNPVVSYRNDANSRVALASCHSRCTAQTLHENAISGTAWRVPDGGATDRPVWYIGHGS